MNALEQVVRSVARQTRVNGVLCLTSNGHPALVAAFAELGWSDPYPVDAADAPVPATHAPFEAATVTTSERAVLDRPKGRLG